MFVCVMSMWGVGGVWHTAVPASESWLGHGTGNKLLSFRCLNQSKCPSNASISFTVEFCDLKGHYGVPTSFNIYNINDVIVQTQKWFFFS